jgi:hypothetical protein
MIQVYLHVLYGTQNKPRFLPHTALKDQFLKPCQVVFTVRYGLGLYYNSVLFTFFVSISEQMTILSHTALTDGILKSCPDVFTAR